MMTSGYNITELVREAHMRWLKPGEVLFILQNYEQNQLTHEPPQKPPSGSLFLFNKKVLRFFRKDGHNWRRKKDGRTVGEAHERLKVGNVEALNCYYAHGEQNPSFQRRSYWILDPKMDHIVLVHYRDITMTGNSAGSVSTLSTGSSTLIQSPDSYATPLSQYAGAFSQFREPYESTSSASSVEVSSDVVNKFNGTSPLSLAEEFGGSPSFEIDVALRRIEEQLSLDEENLKDLSMYYSEKEISNDSGFSIHDQDYGGGSGDYVSQQYPGGYEKPHQYQQQSEGDVSITNQQTLIWNDVIEYSGNPVEDKDYISGYTSANNNPPSFLPQEIEDFKFPAYTPARNLSDGYPDFYSAMFDQGKTEMPLESNLGLTISQEQKFNIRDVAPECGSASESTKVLIIGTFTCDTLKNKWYCMFGDTEVPIEIIQEGVLCCYAPPFPPGKVTLCITSGNRESCSEIREFEYCEKQITNPRDKKSSRSSEEILLLVRFVQMLLSDREGGEEEAWSQLIEGVLDGSLVSYDAIDWLLEELLKEKLREWLSGSRLLSKREQGIIHMVSGLGFGWALTPILDSGVGVNFRDINGWTALHWAARFGREKMVAELVASGAFTGAVTDPSHEDPTGKTPASIAETSGHKGLAGYLSEVSLTTHPSLQTQISHLQPQTTSLNHNNISNEDLSLKDTLAAVRNATQAAARIQSAFRAHSFRKRQQKESVAFSSEEDEYGILPSDIESLSIASKLTFSKNGNDNNAALSIQKKYRGWKGRKDFLALRQKVVKIQAHVRGHQVRKHYMVFCWAVGVVEKVVLRWRRKGVGLRGFKQGGDETEDEDIVKAFRKEKVDVSIDEAVSRVLSMVDSQQARQQYRRMLLKYREAKAEREGGSASQNDVMNI